MGPDAQEEMKPDGDEETAVSALPENPRPAFSSSEQIYGDKIGADKIGRDKIVAQQYIAQLVTVGDEAIDWAAVDYSRHLQRSSFLFIEHMRRFAGTADPEGAAARYLPLRLQDAQFSEKVSRESQDKKEHYKSKWRGQWEERVTYPNRLFLSGDAGSGKTTLLLYECKRLSDAAARSKDQPIPIYIPLRRFSAWSSELMLQHMAEETGLSLRVIKGLWQEEQRPLCLFLDGADEIPAAEQENFAGTIVALERMAPNNYHSFIISHRRIEMWPGWSAG